MLDPSSSAASDPASLGGGAAPPSSPASFISARTAALSRRYQHLLDKSTPFVAKRWGWLALLAAAYLLRVLLIQGFYVVTYGLGIYVLNLLIAFLSPQEDPEVMELTDPAGPGLPVKSSDEFRPFSRRLPEFKFWYSITRAFSIAFIMTFFSAFDVPVFWPILLFYWIVLFTMTMKRQILHMIKYKYVPFTTKSKKRYTGKRAATRDDASLPLN